MQWGKVCAVGVWSLGILMQAVHSGADLQSAAGAVLGYKQAAVKGRTIAVDPVPDAASPALKALLQDCLLAQTHQVRALDDNHATLHGLIPKQPKSVGALATGLQRCCSSAS